MQRAQYRLFSLGMLLWLVICPGMSQGASGQNLRIFSDQLLANTVTAWLEQFPLSIDHTRTNTLTALQALIHARTAIIATTRSLNREERQRYRQINGLTLFSLPVGIDAIGIYASRDSPIRTLSLPQVQALFSATWACGLPHPATTPIPNALYGLTPANGGHDQFSRVALCGASLKPTVTVLAGDHKVIKTLARHPSAYGYASASLATDDGPRLLSLQLESEGRPVAPSPASLMQGRYPLTHYLYLHVRRDVPAAIHFARFILSDKGQAELSAHGFTPLPPSLKKRILLDLARILHESD